MNRKRSAARTWVVAMGVVALLAVAAPVAAQDNPYFEDGATEGSGEGFRVGYISLGDSIPFVKLVSDNIVEQAAIAGLDLITCDSQVAVEEALSCAQQLGNAQVDGVINFQLFEDSSPEICAAYGDVPTVAIDIHQSPCEVSFFGADNFNAGNVAGVAVGEYFAENFDCAYDAVLTLETSGAGQVNEDRTLGAVEGFASVCGDVPEDKWQRLDIGGTTDAALEQVTNVLPTIPPGGRLVVLSLNDDMALGALGAARTAGREGELFIGAQGADPTSWPELACNPQWIADTAYFPERYGRTSVPAIIDILNGVEVAPLLFTPHVAVNGDNIFDLYDTPACA